MIASRSAEILRQLEGTAATDRELLARFVRVRDQSAFAELVRRHAPVVLGACRRVTGHQQDAEDAFQVVFLTLARKASAIGNPELLGNWLYGVAVRVAQTVRRSAVRRRGREVVVKTMPDPPTPPTAVSPELSPILDEELAALPSWYRDAIVLCDLRGVSREKAAEALGVPEGTLSSRLANGRKKLAARLTKRGIALSAATIATALSTAQAAVVPTDLLAKTGVLVADWMADGTIPKPLAMFSEGGLTMRKMLLLGLFSTAVAVAGAVYAAQPAQNPITAELPPAPTVGGKAEPGEQQAPDAKLGDKQVAFTNTPRLFNRLNVNFHGNPSFLWNPQGTQLAVLGKQWERREGEFVYTKNERLALEILTFDPKRQQSATPEEDVQLVGFTPNGKHLLTELREYQLINGFHKLQLWEESPVKPNYLPFARIVRTVELDPTKTQGCAFSADEKTFRTVTIERSPNKRETNKVHVLEIDGTTGKRLKSLLTVITGTYALSSDGKRLAAIEATGEENFVNVYDVGHASKMCSFALPPGWNIGVTKSSNSGTTVSVTTIAWPSSSLTFSPDGRRLLICHGMNDTIFDQSTRFETELSPIAGVIGWTVVLDVDTGKTLPPLEGANHYIDKSHYVDAGHYIDARPTLQAFTGDGRLLALSGVRYTVTTQTIGVVGSNEQRAHFQFGSAHQFLTVWNTDSGKVLKTWDLSVKSAFNPARPVLAVLEPNGDSTRLGLWDFSAEEAEKK